MLEATVARPIDVVEAAESLALAKTTPAKSIADARGRSASSGRRAKDTNLEKVAEAVGVHPAARSAAVPELAARARGRKKSEDDTAGTRRTTPGRSSRSRSREPITPAGTPNITIGTPGSVSIAMTPETLGKSPAMTPTTPGTTSAQVRRRLRCKSPPPKDCTVPQSSSLEAKEMLRSLVLEAAGIAAQTLRERSATPAGAPCSRVLATATPGMRRRRQGEVPPERDTDPPLELPAAAEEADDPAVLDPAPSQPPERLAASKGVRRRSRDHDLASSRPSAPLPASKQASKPTRSHDGALDPRRCPGATRAAPDVSAVEACRGRSRAVRGARAVGGC